MEDEEFAEDNLAYITMCVEPTLYEGLKFAKDLIICNILMRLIIQNIPQQNVKHSLSLLIGGLLLFYHLGSSFIWTLSLAIVAYILIFILSYVTDKCRGFIVTLSVISFLLLCEIIIVNPRMWQQIRGVQMITAMKIISIAIDLDRALFKAILNPIEYGGYILCPANCVLGPWISFHTYNQYMESKILSKKWLKLVFWNICCAMFFLIMSNCIVPWYIYDNSNKWLEAYRDAQSFRMSHYFISSMSVVTMLSAGFGFTNDGQSEIQVTRPYYIELPRSLVQVVIYWNMPMHQWLKQYVFKTCQPYGQFIAIFNTYVISSLLHGLNFQLSAVLLSIGTFSYVEYNFRYKVASALEVCCLANPCNKQCDHRYKKNSFIAVLLNTLFSFVTIIHLAYLGVMFEASFSIQETGYSYYHTLGKWENLNYFSHCFVASLFVICQMM